MNFIALLAVGMGAAIGAWLRWGLGLWLNPLLAFLPAGTLAANWLGGYIMGLAVAVFGAHPGISPEIRLFATTGFLGGLTTFSTFSAEAATFVQRQQWGDLLIYLALHVFGSLVLTLLGLLTIKWMRL